MICRNIRVLLTLLLTLPLPWTAAAFDNADCFTCHEDQTLTKKGANGQALGLCVDPAKYKTSVHATNACTSCHADITEAPHPDGFTARPVNCATCHARAALSYSASIHAIARQAGKTNAAVCVDCHGKHDILPRQAAASPLRRENQGATCGKCHPQIMTEVRNSVHGKAMAHGAPDAPACTSCHADHQIGGLKTVSPYDVAKDICSPCHASERFNARYNLPADRVTSFFASYHGMAARFGSNRSANCASCHGYHNILPSSDPRSMVNRANMVKTCQKCHPAANENFSFGTIHLAENSVADIGSRINWWVRHIYLLLIVGVIGGMLVHNALSLRRKFLAMRATQGPTVLRMSQHQRIQHALLFTSFIALTITGFALKYPDSWLRYLVGASENVRRLGHRAAALVMLALAVYHVIYWLRSREGGKLVKDLCPRWKDVLDVFDNLRYLIFPRARKPAFARFSYAEKAEYWAVVWGTVIMGLTGLMIWFKMSIVVWLPRWVIDVAITIHYYEAILAALAILVWHFYHVMFDPDVYPMNTAWWNGRMPEHLYREEHALDTETPAEAEQAATPATPAPKAGDSPKPDRV